MSESYLLMMCVIVIISVLSVFWNISKVPCKVVSSAYIRNENLLVTFWKSFMLSIKSNGPSIEP